MGEVRTGGCGRKIGRKTIKNINNLVLNRKRTREMTIKK